MIKSSPALLTISHCGGGAAINWTCQCDPVRARSKAPFKAASSASKETCLGDLIFLWVSDRGEATFRWGTNAVPGGPPETLAAPSTGPRGTRDAVPSRCQNLLPPLMFRGGGNLEVVVGFCQINLTPKCDLQSSATYISNFLPPS